MRYLRLLNLFIIFVHTAASCELHDVTTLIHLNKNAKTVFEVHSRTDAVGLPLDFSNGPRFNEPVSAFSCEFNETAICPGWTSTVSFVPSKLRWKDPILDGGDEGLRLSGKTGEMLTSEFALRPDKLEICVALSYFLEENVNVTLLIFLTDNAIEHSVFHPQDLKGTGKEFSQQFSFLKPQSFHGTVKVKLKLGFAYSQGNGTFVVRSVKECIGDRDLSVVLVTENMISSGSRFGNRFLRSPYTSYGQPEPRHPKVGYSLKCKKERSDENLYSDLIGFAGWGEVVDFISGAHDSILCENDGVKIDGQCQCFPGYVGPSCEQACPPNHFGKDCGGICDPFGNSGCKGIQLAAPGMGFGCPRGYYGDECKYECPASWHGPSCKLRCGHCVTGTCDPFSGLCKGPCALGYLGTKCNKRLASAEVPTVTATGFDFIEGHINIELNEEELKSYPYAEIKYTEAGGNEESILIAIECKKEEFRIGRLYPGRNYYLYPILIHESGSYFKDAELRVAAATECNTCSEISNIDVITEIPQLTVTWDVTGTCDYSCPRSSIELEINSPDLEETLQESVGPNDIKKEIRMLNVPSEGTARLRPMYHTKPGSWSSFFHFQHNYGFLKVVNKTDRSIGLVWKKNDGPKNDTIVCKVEALACQNSSSNSLSFQQTVHLVSGETFTIGSLHPFAHHSCSLQNEKLSISTTTNPALPSSAPEPHLTIANRVSYFSGSIYWSNAECLEINGLRDGFLVELYCNGTLARPAEKISNPEPHLFHYFGDLESGTAYEARVYVLNHLGYNPEKYFPVNFVTKKSYYPY